MTLPYDGPDGFILSDAAMYSYICQTIYPDIISFAAAIPDHLKQLFLTPIKVERITTASVLARRVSRCRCAGHKYADGMTPTGDTPDADLFGTKTFVNDDCEPTVPSSAPGSIFQIDDADSITHHQEYDYDQNIQVPTDTSYNSDVDITDSGFEYPYRGDEKVRHSSKTLGRPVIMRLALKPEIVEPHTPEKIQKNARSCKVKLISYDKRTRVFTFAVDSGNGPRNVQASLSDINDVALICDCPFWQWNGPEHNAQSNSFLLGQPYGTASPPNIRDPNREYWLCKHAYAVLRRLDTFVQEVIGENWEKSNEELLDEVDEEWDRLEGVSNIPLDEIDDEEIDVDWEEEPTEEEPESIEEESIEDYSGGEEEEPEEEEPEEEEPEEEEPEDYSGGEEEEPEDYSGGEEEEPEAEEPVEDYEIPVHEMPMEEAEEPVEDYEIPIHEMPIKESEEEEPEDYSGESDEDSEEEK